MINLKLVSSWGKLKGLCRSDTTNHCPENHAITVNPDSHGPKSNLVFGNYFNFNI